MLEIEMKFAVADFDGVIRTLSEWQAQSQPAIDEADHYYNAPDRDFSRTDEAFRLRRIGARNILTYKGPKQTGPAKTRTEIEVPLEAGAETAEGFGRLALRLGYRPTAVVRKKRTIWHCRRGDFELHVCLDDVEEVGRYIELEIVATQDRRPQAERVLQEVAADLGLHQSERRSYLEMLLQRRGTLALASQQERATDDHPS